MVKKNKELNMSKRSFTLIELLVAIALVGILSGFVFVQLNGAINTARDGEKKANLASINKALLIYKTTNGAYPIQTSSCTIGDTCTTLNSALSGTLPTIPSGQTYTYQSNADGSDYTISTVLSTSYSYTYDPDTGYATNTPTAGICGSSNGANLSSAPTTNLCSPDQSVIVSGSGPWTWSCPGTYGGSSTPCSTGGVPAPGVCGSKNGKYASSTPTGTEACATGTVSGMTGTYSWSCAGPYGGSSVSCATVAATYSVQSFTTLGTTLWTAPAGVNSVEYLIVAGGGGGYNGWYGGGGGAGGMLTGTISVTPGNSYTLTVGAGGAGGYNGGNSVFASLTAIGGGTSGSTGGSGGGAPAYSGSTGGSGTSGQGNAGGASGYGCGYGNDSGGGGGGAGAAGGNSPGCSTAGAGGAGRASSITGSSVYYAGGGGGGGGAPAAGGVGGGGNGNGGNATYYGGGGAGNTNGGGGGAGYQGIVVLKYVTNY